MKTFKQKFDACIYGVFCGAINFLVMRYVS